MAEIRPFRGLRYNTSKVRLEDVVTQPYDKISPAMQRGYYERNAANFIRFELPLAGEDPYAGAKKFLAEMRRSGVMRLEERPALYIYEQSFEHPTEPGKRCQRRALIALGRLHDYDEGVIYRHEQTLTGPKKDREQLLKTTGVQSGLLFMLYDDPEDAVGRLSGESADEFVDDLGVRQRLWPVTDAGMIEALQARLLPLPLFIADGHHRYETALGLRRSRDGKYAEDFAMMALVNMKSEGLIVLPTHRAIFDVPAELFARGMERLKTELQASVIEVDAQKIGVKLRDIRDDHFACVVATAAGAALIDVPRTELQARYAGRSCELDVEALHVIFEEYFGITTADVTAQRFVRYHRYMKEALQDVASGAQAAFLIRPVSVATIRDRSLRGALMPQKSTDFYPKMNSGLTLYSWEESLAGPTLAKPARVGHPRQE